MIFCDTTVVFPYSFCTYTMQISMLRIIAMFLLQSSYGIWKTQNKSWKKGHLWTVSSRKNDNSYKQTLQKSGIVILKRLYSLVEVILIFTFTFTHFFPVLFWCHLLWKLWTNFKDKNIISFHIFYNHLTCYSGYVKKSLLCLLWFFTCVKNKDKKINPSGRNNVHRIIISISKR